MFETVLVIRAQFKMKYGSSSTLIAVSSMDDVKEAIDAYAEKTDSEFIEITDQCVMTPSLYIKDKE